MPNDILEIRKHQIDAEYNELVKPYRVLQDNKVKQGYSLINADKWLYENVMEYVVLSYLMLELRIELNDIYKIQEKRRMDNYYSSQKH